MLISKKLQIAVFTLIFFATSFVQAGNFVCGKRSTQKVIIDTDLDSDVDDAGALAMLFNLHKEKKIELLGIIVTSDDPYSPVCASAIAKYYGYPEIPVGFLKDQPALQNHSRYTKQIAEEFPSRLKSWKDSEDSVALYRRLLSGSPDNSVVIITIGHLSSLQGLLKSQADEVSDLDGLTLVNKKADKWICMGGKYPSGKEANFYRPDPGSTVYCVNNWSKNVIFSGWELGTPIITGGTFIKTNLPSDNPVYKAYELYNQFSGRQSWDQTAVMLLLKEGRQLISYVNGNCIVADDGSNTWQSSRSGRHRYIVLKNETSPDQVSNYINRLMAGIKTE